MKTITSILCVLSVCGLVACDKSKEDGAKSKSEAAGEGANKGSEKSSLASSADLFTGTKPTLPTEVAKATFGAKKVDVLKAINGDILFKSKKTKGVTFNLDFDSKSKALKKLKVELDAKAEELLTPKWGKPLKTPRDLSYWVNPEAGLRATISKYGDGKDLVFEPYVPLQKYLGATGKTFAFLGDKPLLGATLEELKKAWGDTLCNFDEVSKKITDALKSSADSPSSLGTSLRNNSLMFCRGPLEMENGRGIDRIYFGLDGKAQSFRMTVRSEGMADLATRNVATLKAKFGEGKSHASGDNMDHFFWNEAKQLSVQATAYKDGGLSISLNTYTSLKTLMGSGPRFGFETPGLIGGTYESIAKAHPKTFIQQGEKMAILYLPAAPYNKNPLQVSLSRWSKATIIHGYRFVVHYRDYPKFGEEVFAAMKSKFGEPTKDPKSTEKDTFFSWKKDKDGMTIRARRVSDQWQITVSSGR